MEVGSKDRDLVHPEVSSTPKTETDVYIAPDVYFAPVIQKIDRGGDAELGWAAVLCDAQVPG